MSAFVPGQAVDAVVLAAGSSVRFGGQDKLSADLCGRPVAWWAISALLASPAIADLILVIGPGDRSGEPLFDGLGTGGRLRTVLGGPRRRDSVAAGMAAATSRYVCVHDGARPLVTPALVEAVVVAARGNELATAAIPITDTLVLAGQDGCTDAHLDRSHVLAIQTPQVVLRERWLEAAALSNDDETDETAMLARLGARAVIVPGDPSNLKITHPGDLEVARSLLRARGVTCSG